MEQPVCVLCVDDETSILKALKRLFLDGEYEIFTAVSGPEGLEILEENPCIQVVVSDYRMPGMNGVDFLREVCRRWPETVRIVLSGYADTASVVSAINEGEIYKFIPKPWNDDELKVTIANAAERYFLHKQNLELTRQLQEKNETLHRINENLEQMVEERTQEILFQNKALQTSQNILDALPLAVVGLDPGGLIVQCNHKGWQLFPEGILGRDRQGVFSAPLNALIDQVLVQREVLQDIETGGKRYRVRGAFMQAPGDQQGIILVFEEHVHG